MLWVRVMLPTVVRKSLNLRSNPSVFLLNLFTITNCYYYIWIPGKNERYGDMEVMLAIQMRLTHGPNWARILEGMQVNVPRLLNQEMQDIYRQVDIF